MTDHTPPLGPLPEPDAWRITDGEGGYDYRDDEPEAFNVAWAARYGRKHETLHTADQMRAYALQERSAERERIKAALLGMDDAVKGLHNYYAHAAWVLFERAEPGKDAA